ncbi:hypothetical protein EPI10_005743 [Gossypium australe]|uniref:Uncharacterized protein n=1 Tax=Gossypium australe TaxID=47621 RepID=A0A5B6WQU9_9ROSI|nr:hypothetical protein EPI10_005743 [Gossypium australe]
MMTTKNVRKITFNRTMSKVCGLFKDQVPRHSAKKRGATKQGSLTYRSYVYPLCSLNVGQDFYRGNAFLIRFCLLKSKFLFPGMG